MRKRCLKSANDEDAHQSMHPVCTVGSVNATNKNIDNELSQPANFKGTFAFFCTTTTFLFQ